MASQTIQHIENGSGTVNLTNLRVYWISYLGSTLMREIEIQSVKFTYTFTPRSASPRKDYGCEFRIDVPNMSIGFNVLRGDYPYYFDFRFKVCGHTCSFRSTDNYFSITIPWSDFEDSSSAIVTDLYIDIDGGRHDELVAGSVFVSSPRVLNVTFNNSIATGSSQTITYEIWGKLLSSTANEKFQLQTLANETIIERIDFPYTRTGAITWSPSTADYAPYFTDRYINCPVTLGFARRKVTSEAIYSVYYTDIYLTLYYYDIYPQATITVSEGNPEKSALFGTAFVTGVSCYKIIPEINVKYGASVAALTIEAVGEIYEATIGTAVLTGTIRNMNDDMIVVKVTDSRGITVTMSVKESLVYTFLEWKTPVLTKFEVRRGYYNSATYVFTPNDNGDYCEITYQASWSPVGNLNVAEASLTIPESSRPVHPIVSNYGINGEIITPADTESSYDITITLSDLVTSVPFTIKLSTAGVVFDVKAGGSGLGLGKIAEYEECVEINPQWDFRVYGMTLEEYIREVVGNMNS